MKTLTRAILATSLVAGLGFSQTALAETATTELQVNAGLAEALTLSCDTAMSFGITRLGNLDRSAVTTLTLDPSNNNLTVTNDDGNVGVTAGEGQAGECIIAGSAAANTTSVTVSFSTPDDLAGNTSAFGNLTAPASGSDISGMAVSITSVTGVTIGETGGASFNIGGVLTIPATATPQNMGGYSTTTEVTVNDGFGD